MRFPLILAAAAVLTGAQSGEESAEELLQKTKTTTVVYAAYTWIYERDDEGERRDSWSAELHAGDWHRGESKWIRTLANCRTHKGWVFNMQTQQLSANDTVWLGACGISTGNQIVAVDRLAPKMDAKYGPLQTLRVTDRGFVRFYAIDARGVIIRNHWTAANGSPAPCIQSEPIAILTRLPAGNVFDPQSLKRSVIAERYKVMPKGPAPVGMSGKSCG